ncbi:MAG: sulfate ABC transporter permease [Eubacterium sp.]|nr:sulfate ABC transporter permease [Eubacterium sp.]
MKERKVMKSRNKNMKKQQNGIIPFLLLLSGILFFFVMLVFPLGEVIYRSLKEGMAVYGAAITAKNTLSALKVTLIAMVIAVAVNTFFGLCASWLLTKFDFRGKQVLSTLIDIPFSISPVIAGLAYIMTFGRMGWATPMIEKINGLFGTDISLVFSVPGVVLATIFVTFPFVSRELIPVMQAQGSSEEEAAVMMGAKGFTVFRKVTFPHVRWALLYGVILCAARAFGEFGAVYAVSKARGKTFTLPLEIDALYMAGSAESITQAFAVSSLLVLLSIMILVVKQIVEYRGKREM